MRFTATGVAALFVPLALGFPAGRAQAQSAAGTQRSAAARLTGVVRDSIAHAPLAGAIVQVVDADSASRFTRTVTADSSGHYDVGEVPKGRYLLGFYHPMLDSLAIAAPLREVHVDAPLPVRADLAIPSAGRIRSAICGVKTVSDSVHTEKASAVLVGVVRDAKSLAPVSGASVMGRWVEFTFTTKGIVRRTPNMTAVTGENGWFALCNVPNGGTITILASRGTDSTDFIDAVVPAEGFLRRELYLGGMETVVAAVPSSQGDTASGVGAAPVRRIRKGNGRLSGRVTAVLGGAPLVGAQVRMVDGPSARTDGNGEWTLADAPQGTRMLEIRAVGYYPERRRVDVVDNAPPLRVSLSTLKAMLDTVRITARRIAGKLDNGLEERKTTAIGHFLSAADIARRAPSVTSDLFKMVPGLRVDGFGPERTISMRGAFTTTCSPAIYLDGSYVGGDSGSAYGAPLAADDLDTWISPERIEAIEVYTQGNAPPQFQQGMGDCGSIVIWTK